MTSNNSTRETVIYTRLSKVKEHDKADGNDDVNTAEQEAKCRALADLRELTVTRTYTDNDLTAYHDSGRYKGRPGFDAMLEQLRTGNVGVVLVYHIYRLYRSLPDLSRLTKICQEHGIAIQTVSGGDIDLTTATGQMVAEFLASVGKQEVALLRERAMDGKARNRDRGRWPGGRVPYGYRVDGQFTRGTGSVTVDETEADIIRGMCADVIAGKSLHEIARDLNRRDVPLPGKPIPGRRLHRPRGWDATDIGRIVVNTRYAALVTYKGEIIGDGDWPAIITLDTLKTVRAELTHRPASRRGRTGPEGKRWLLSGIVRCGKCGSQRTRALRLSNGRHGYTCRECFGVTRDTERVDKMAVDKVLRMLAHPAFASALRPSADIAALNTRREELTRELEEWAATRTTPRAYRVATEPLYAELDRIEEKLSEAYRGTGLEDIAGAPDPAAKWPTLTITQQRAVVRALIDVTILPLKDSDMKGPEKDWKVGDTWFRPDSVRIEPKLP